jgi:hypothetical protein
VRAEPILDLRQHAGLWLPFAESLVRESAVVLSSPLMCMHFSLSLFVFRNQTNSLAVGRIRQPDLFRVRL